MVGTLRSSELDLIDPPPDLARVLRWASVGPVLATVAVVLNAISDTVGSTGSAELLDGARLVLMLFAAVISGATLTLRPSWAVPYLLTALTMLLGIWGLPESWDSFRLLAKISVGVSLFGALVVAVPRKIGYGLIVALVAFYFTGILTAVTSPAPQPWISAQLWTRVFRPLLLCIYMNNAYQFYSPDPGPAQQIWACIHYDTPEVKERFQWVKLPLRPRDVRDPLAISYYRRLSISERLNYGIPAQQLFASGLPEELLPRELVDVRRRRTSVPTDLVPSPQALNNLMPPQLQYRPPIFEVQRAHLPSYARHIIEEFARKDLPVKYVKVFRAEHRMVTPRELTGIKRKEVNPEVKSNKEYAVPPLDPYAPETFLPFYLGKYDPQGNLMDPRDPMLFWYTPIMPGPDGKDYCKILGEHEGN